MTSTQADVGSSTHDVVVRALQGRSLLARLGVEIASVVDGRVTIRLALETVSAADPAHGGIDRSLVIALGDAAGWLAVVAALCGEGGSGRSAVSTLEQKVDLVVPPIAPVALQATGWVIRRGRSLSSARSDVVAVGPDGQETTVGLLQGTYAAG